MISGPPLHIAIAIYGLTSGGASRRILTLAEAFADRGHRLDMIVVDPTAPLTQHLPSTIRLIALDDRWPVLGRRPRRRRSRVWAATWSLARHLKQAPPEVLLSGASHMNLACLLAKRLAGSAVPLALRASNTIGSSGEDNAGISGWRRRLVQYCYPWADAVIAVSGGCASDVIATTGIAPARVVTIANPTFTPDLAARAAAALDHPWFSAGSPPVILGVGRLSQAKDFPTLVAAFARVRAVRPVRLVILGEGKQRAVIEAAADRLGIAGDVLLPGYVDNPLAWMARAAVFVLSSRWEGLPGVIIEAFAAGCPVVSTNCRSGPAEILDDGLYGRLVPVGDDAAMAAAVLATLDEPRPSDVLRDRAAQFSVERAVDGYLAVLARAARQTSQ
jgi:glycosyltransferase involved in cell wall biosynthesis